MNYLINPWLIYLIDKADIIFAFSIASLIVSVLICILAFFIEQEGCFTEEGEEQCRKCRKISLIVGIVALIIICVFPTSTTITKMVVASYVTDTNIDKTKEEITEIVDYICDKVNEVKE